MITTSAEAYPSGTVSLQLQTNRTKPRRRELTRVTNLKVAFDSIRVQAARQRSQECLRSRWRDSPFSLR